VPPGRINLKYQDCIYQMLSFVIDLTSCAAAAACSVAMKVFPSQNLALSKRAAAKAMGNGQYAFWMDGGASGVPAAIDPSTTFYTAALSGVTTLQACLERCTNRNLCVGAGFGAYDLDTDVIGATCKLIMAKVQVGTW
jgi:hypothetical protein